MMKEIAVGAAGAVMAAAILGTFMMYSDVQVAKEKMESVQKIMGEREVTTKRYTDMMHHMDKAITVQAQSVNALEGAVTRLEKFVMLAYKNEQLKHPEIYGEAK